jgi:hypothetical protein
VLTSILDAFSKVVDSKSAVPILLICGIFGFMIYALQVLTVVIPSLESNNNLAKNVGELAETLKIETINSAIDNELVNAKVAKLQKSVASVTGEPVEDLELSDSEITRIEKNVMNRYERLNYNNKGK